jgi:ABC-type branched-subunit amino acid transport system substrate-binding protein
VWGIHGNEMADRLSIFGSVPSICPTCLQRSVPYAASVVGATRVASLGYDVSENSRLCSRAVADSIERYTGDVGAELAYLNDGLAFGLPNGIGPEVSAMRDAGVDFISTCLDLNGMKTLAQELERQGMGDVVLYHPNTYNQQFVSDAGGVFEGDFVSVQFLPFEAEAEGTALADFVEWMDETGSEPSELAMVGWINADLAFQGLLAAGPDFTRESVVAATNALTDYDAGGLVVPVDWSRQHTPEVEGEPGTGPAQECTSLVRVVDGAFETVAPPATPWLCWSNESDDWSDPVPTSFG